MFVGRSSVWTTEDTMSKLRTVFYHINKCAGTTLLNYLLSVQSMWQVDRIEDYGFTSTGHRDLRDLNRLLRAKFIHDPSGTADWDALLGNCTQVTWLRDPVERVASQIQMVARWTDEEASSVEARLMRDVARRGVIPFLELDHDVIHGTVFNGITWFFQFADDATRRLWTGKKFRGLSQLEERAYHNAIRNIERMDFIGFVETFDDSFLAMRRLLGLNGAPVLQHHNVRRHGVKCSAEERQAILPFVELDHAIYEHAQKLAAERQGYLAGSDPIPAPDLVPASVLMSADTFTGGSGWHVCEINGAKISRWAGPGDQASISFAIRKDRDLYVRLRISDYISADQINALHFSIDGTPVGVNIHALMDNGFAAEAWIEADKLDQASPFLQLDIHFGRSRKSTDNRDERKLGVEVCELEAGPFEAYRPGSVLGLNTLC